MSYPRPKRQRPERGKVILDTDRACPCGSRAFLDNRPLKRAGIWSTKAPDLACMGCDAPVWQFEPRQHQWDNLLDSEGLTAQDVGQTSPA